MRIDSHHHFWRLARGGYDWLTPDLGAIVRDFEPADLSPLLAANGISETIVVQASASEAETGFLLDIARHTDFVAGVVGWVDLAASDAPERIAVLAANGYLKGLRPMLQDIADDDFILSDAVAPALAAMMDHGLRLDALVQPRHLPILVTLRQRWPQLPMVIDHAAKPDLSRAGHSAWARDLAAVATDGVTCCKLSGLVTEAGPGWSLDTLAPFVETLLDLFGPQRLMWGSDWPVLTLAADYAQWLAACETLLERQSEAVRAAIFGDTARRFYGLEV